MWFLTQPVDSQVCPPVRYCDCDVIYNVQTWKLPDELPTPKAKTPRSFKWVHDIYAGLHSAIFGHVGPMGSRLGTQRALTTSRWVNRPGWLSFLESSWPPLRGFWEWGCGMKTFTALIYLLPVHAVLWFNVTCRDSWHKSTAHALRGLCSVLSLVTVLTVIWEGLIIIYCPQSIMFCLLFLLL